MAELTARSLRAKWRGTDQWLSDGGPRGAGSLVARIQRDSAMLYFRYAHPAGSRKLLPLGPFDESGSTGVSLRAARERAAKLAELYRSGITDIHGHLKREREAEERRLRIEREAAIRAQGERERGNLQELMRVYVEYLERGEKQSAGDVRSIFSLHVTDAAPDVATQKAAEVSVEDFVRLIAKLVEAGKGRTAAKLRSYLRAAYSLAIRSRTDPDVPLVMRTFGITSNPVAAIDALSRYNRTRERALTAPEFSAFMARLNLLPATPQKDAIELCIFLGGQRPVQLLRLRAADVDLAAGLVVLYDRKGARKRPRRHVVPLTSRARAILKRRLMALRENEPLFSTDGKRPMRIETLTNFVAAIAEEMMSCRESLELFQLRDVRRTAETLLASIEVSSDVRAQIQSHGLGGVQQRHYDKHSYLAEKRQALEQWARYLNGV